MKIIAIIFFLILSIICWILWWQYITLWELILSPQVLLTYTANDSVILIVLAGMFVLGVLFGKLLSSWSQYKNSRHNTWVTTESTATKKNTEVFSFIPETETVYSEATDSAISHTKSVHSEKIESTHDESFDYWPESYETKTDIEKILVQKKDNTVDDFQVIEGIWPKLESILKKWWIQSYKQLATARPEEIMNILKKQWPRYSIHKPDTWSKQAQLADRGMFDQLTAYQNTLVKGVEKS